jgi:hypothetical protein
MSSSAYSPQVEHCRADPIEVRSDLLKDVGSNPTFGSKDLCRGSLMGERSKQVDAAY